jgi:hypothetical protein
VRRAGRDDSEALSVRGRNSRARGNDRVLSVGGRRDPSTPGSRRGAPRRDGRPSAPAAQPPVEIVEVPAPPVGAPAPEQPAQLAEVPQSDIVLRPEAEVLVPEASVPEPSDSYPGFQPYSVPEQIDRVVDGALSVIGLNGHDRDRRRGHGHGHGRHGRHGR